MGSAFVRTACSVGSIVSLLAVAGCRSDGGESAGMRTETRKPTIRLAHADWSTEIATTNLVKALLQERMGYPCRIESMPAEQMWRAVAEGEVDGMLSAWLPDTHAHYRERYGDEVEDLGPHLEGTRIGLVVPDVSVGRQTDPTGKQVKPYITAGSIGDLGRYAEKFKYRVIGIDPGAGIMKKTREALETYGIAERFQLIEGSEREMTRELSDAIRRQEWIVVTGWQPHWMFGFWKLRFLDDPENVFGGRGTINTLVRKGLREDHPEVHAVLDRFYWTVDDMDQLVSWNHKTGTSHAYENAIRWIESHEDEVESWLSAGN